MGRLGLLLWGVGMGDRWRWINNQMRGVRELLTQNYINMRIRASRTGSRATHERIAGLLSLGEHDERINLVRRAQMVALRENEGWGCFLW